MILLGALLAIVTAGRVLDIDDFGGAAGDTSDGALAGNVHAFTAALRAASSGDTVLIRNSSAAYHFRGTVVGYRLSNVTILFEGKVELDDDISKWPPFGPKARGPWLLLTNTSHVTISGGGTIDGHGLRWWDASITGSSAGIGAPQ